MAALHNLFSLRKSAIRLATLKYEKEMRKEIALQPCPFPIPLLN